MSWHRRLWHLVTERIGAGDHRFTDSPLLELHVEERVRDLGLPGPDAWVAELERSEREWPGLLDLVLNGQTSFFRDEAQIAAVGDLLVERAARVRRPLYVWSAGCSTGEEPYSVAILAETLGVDALVVGSDLNVRALEAAEAGRYRSWSLRQVDATMLSVAFDEEEDQHRVKASIRERVRFEPHNLIKDAPLLPPSGAAAWDVILCRNVLIYYGEPVARAVIEKLCGVLDEGGVLSLASSEILLGLPASLTPLRARGRVFYRRGAGGLTGASRAPRAPPVERAAGSSAERAAQWAAGWDAERPIDEQAPEPVLEQPMLSYLAAEERLLSLLGDGELASAVALLEEVLSRNPDDLVALVTKGHLHARMHAFDEALETYARAERLDPLLPEVHLFQGIVHRKRGAWEPARAALQRAVFLDPHGFAAAFFLVGALERLGKDVEADRTALHVRRLLTSPARVEAFLTDPQVRGPLLPEADECLRAVERRLRARGVVGR